MGWLASSSLSDNSVLVRGYLDLRSEEPSPMADHWLHITLASDDRRQVLTESAKGW